RAGSAAARPTRSATSFRSSPTGRASGRSRLPGARLHLGDQHLERDRLVLLALGDRLELRLAPRAVAQAAQAVVARDQQDAVLERDPERVLEEAPPFGIGDAVDRLRIEHAAQEVI